MTWPPDRPDRYGPPAGRRGQRDSSDADRRASRRAPEEIWPAGQWPRRDPGPGQPPRTGRDGRADPRAGGPPWGNDPHPPADSYPDPYGGDPYRGRPAGPGYTEPARDIPEPGGPAPRQSGVRRGITAVAAVLSVLILLVATGGWAVLRHYDGKVHHVPLAFSASADRPASASGRTQNILLVGSDTRAGTNGEFGQAEGQRSDTTILAHLDGNGSTTLISFPRDLWVRIPAYADSSGKEHPAQKSKLNAAYSYGGPSLLVATIETLTGIRVDHYVQIDFVGFQGMTDALGGVTVCIKELPPELKARGFDNLHDRWSGFSGQVGANRLNGAQALAFVRQRFGLPESDLDRIRRQQQFLGAVFQAISSTGTLLNPSKLINVVDAATSALTLDDSTSLADLRLLAVRMQSIGSGGVAFATVPANPSQVSGQSALVPDPAQLAAFLKPYGGRSEQATTTGAGPLGSGSSGAAGSTGSTGGSVPRIVPVAWSASPAGRQAALAAGTDDGAAAASTAGLVTAASAASAPPAPPEGVSCTY